MRSAFLVLFLIAGPGMLQAQSQFGVRGLGFPGRALSVRSIGSAGALGLFDPESSQNPAALGGIPTLTSAFTITQGLLEVENPAGTASVRDMRFPQLLVAGPVPRMPAAVGVSFSNYMNRDFSLATPATIDIGGESISVSDTFSSRGGLNDLRLAGAYRIRERWGIGLGVHLMTGSTRLTSVRIFNDGRYLSSRQKSELSFAGAGLSVGLMHQAGTSFGIAALVRWDGNVKMDRDSTRVGTIDLPYTFGLGLRGRAGANLNFAAQSLFRTWSAANSDLLALGGTGARNTLEVSAGGEYASDPQRPFNRPIRFGARYATLPFPLVASGEQGSEFEVSVGTGVRLAQQRAGIDVGLEHVWRSEGPHSERGFILSLGVSVRP